MNPGLEAFLEDALESVQPTSSGIGRVVVEPDYNNSPLESDGPVLAQQLRELIQRQSPDAAALASPEGYEVDIPGDCCVLAKYIRSITLHQDGAEGAWVEVAPPGNWI
ncbi:MAG TPA: hypothetical protein VMF91_02855 [Bryobacteraceae bacterium]|nr:hypothetical protein [Bryobacteraceae bacterium]